MSETTTTSDNSPSDTSPTRAPAPTVWPTLHADDARALIEFLTERVGFAPTVVIGDGDVVEHAQLDWPEGGGVMLGSRRPDSAVSPGIASVYVVTGRVDEIHQRVKDVAGVRVTRPPEDTDYGSHQFVMTDPEGNFWCFGTYRGEPR